MASQVQQVRLVEQSHPSWVDDPLGFLIAPMSREEFFERYYEQAPLLSARNEPQRYADMLTLDMLDAFIDSADLRDGMLDLANHQNRIPKDAYVNEGGRIITPVVAEEYLKGATIILPHLHDSMAELGEFCRALESVFSVHVQTNIYLTPPSNQGFPVHYDNHDVFVLQISGSKSWRFYGQPVTTPYRGEQFEMGKHDPGPVTDTFTLKPGDCVYVPRGLMHDAPNVGEEPSLHITVGLITKTWADLILESVSELALSEPAFRQSLPPGFAHRDFDRAAAQAHFATLTRLIGEKASMDAAFDLMADNFLRDRRPNLAGIIKAGADVPREGELYRMRRLAPWNVADDDGQIVLIGPGGDLNFKEGDGDALDVALSGRPFTLADLPCEDKEDFFRTLWANGYLERA
jgi:bifunctional lysine-specific demethylase and histidyl-hydroxylase NO66